MEIIKTKYLKLTFKYNFLRKILKCSSRTKIKSLKNNKVLERESNYFIINENGKRPLLFIHSGMYSKNPLNIQIKFLNK